MDERYISELAFDAAMSRLERTIVRLWIICIILIVALLGTNAAWLYYESQWQVTETTITQDVEATSDGDSDINLNTVGGDYYGGQGKSKTNE